MFWGNSIVKSNEMNHSEIGFNDLVKMIFKRKVTLGLFILIPMIFSVIYSYTMTPIYSAQAQVLIEGNSSQTATLEAILRKQTREVNFLETQYILLKSRALIKSVIQKLELEESEEFKPRESLISFEPLKKSISWVLGLIFVNNKDEPIDDTVTDPYTKLVNTFLKRLTISPVRKTQVVNVVYQGYSPELAAKIVNTLCETFIEKNIELKSTIDQGTGEWLRKRVKEVNEELKESELALQKYKEEHDALELEEKRGFANQKLGRILRDISVAKSERLRWEAIRNQVLKMKRDPKEMLQSLPDELKSENVVRLRKEYIAFQQELIVLSKSYGSSHPTIITLKAKIDAIEKRIPDEMNRVLRSVNNEFEAAREKENIMQSALDNMKKRAIKADKETIEYTSLKHEVEANKKLFDLLLNRMKQINVRSQISETNIRVVDTAEVPLIPVKPNKILYLLIAMTLGFFGGFIFVSYKEFQDKTVKSENQLENSLPFPVLGTVSTLSGKKDKRFPILNINSQTGSEFRDMVTNLRWILAEPHRVIMVTSTLCGEGKATVAANLAVGIAQVGKRVLLVDADLRQPKLNAFFKTKPSPGLADLLQDVQSIQKVGQETKFKGLWVLPTGTVGPNSYIFQDLFNPEKFKKVISFVRNKFDVVLLVTSPAKKFSDASFIEKFCDGIVYVVEAGKNDPKTIERAIEQLSKAPALSAATDFLNGNGVRDDDGHGINGESLRRIGLVLNKVD